MGVSKEILKYLTRESLKELLEGQIRDCVGGLIEMAQQIEGGDCEQPLGVEDGEAVGKILWEQTNYTDTAQAARICGELDALFMLADHFGLRLDRKVEALRDWRECINPV